MTREEVAKALDEWQETRKRVEAGLSFSLLTIDEEEVVAVSGPKEGYVVTARGEQG